MRPNTSNYAYAPDVNVSDTMAPLVKSPHESGNGMTRRRYLVGEDISAQPGPRGTHTRLPLRSSPVGHFRPIATYNNDEYDNDASKRNGTQLHQRIFINCVKCIRYCGCSNQEAVSHEGFTGNYYRDEFNDQPYNCSLGNSEEHGIWMNQSDTPGSIMAFMVWFLLGYSAVTITFLAETGGIQSSLSMLYAVLCSLALASHAKTQFTDPGTVSTSAQPVESVRNLNPDAPLTMCSQCLTFKPPMSHHCRICNRCISRMDHHCPWMNNCVGAGNFKHFVLFLLYTWLCSVFSLGLLGWNYFFCVDEDCTFSMVLVQLTRVMTLLSTVSFLFTSSMIMNVIYGVITGIGTIDRLKKKATNTMMMSDEAPIHLKDIFGMDGYHTWIFPIDPVFEDYDVVMGFSTPQRLLREQVIEKSMGDFYARSHSKLGSEQITV